MKRCTFLLLFLCFLLIAQNVIADKGGIPHHLKAGQIVSADVLNEIFESLAFTDKIPTRDDFLGSWTCRRTFTGATWASHFTSSTTEQGILYVTTSTITFSTDGLGNYSAIETSTPSVLYPIIGEELLMTGPHPYATKDGFLFLTFTHPSLGFSMSWSYIVTFRNAVQFSLEHDRSMEPDVGGGIVCDRTDIPPNIPELTSASVNGTSVTLSWTDTSDDETGFIVLRKDSLNGDWLQVGPVVGASSGTRGTLTYTNTDLAAGTYWYRVQSVNTYGKSLGSNIFQSDVQ